MYSFAFTLTYHIDFNTRVSFANKFFSNDLAQVKV